MSPISPGSLATVIILSDRGVSRKLAPLPALLAAAAIDAFLTG